MHKQVYKCAATKCYMYTKRPTNAAHPPSAVSRRESLSFPVRQCPANEMLIGGPRGFSMPTHRPISKPILRGWCCGVKHRGRWRAPIPVGARTIASSRRATAMQFWLLSAIVGICAAYSTPAAPLGLQRSACVTPLSTINVQPARTSTVCVAEATCVHVVDQVSENDLMG